jgi:exonuclease III
MKIRSRYISIILLIILSACSSDDEVNEVVEEEFSELRIMTYNILYTTFNEQTLKVLQETNADIIGLQEISTARIAELAQKLKYHFYAIPKTSANMSGQDTGILSRFPITRFLTNGIVVKVNPDLEVALFTVHLSPYPYEPYDFRDGIITTAQEAITSAANTRLHEIAPVFEEIESLHKEGIPIFLTGDFNEPSHLDWTTATADQELHFGKVVDWPVSNGAAENNLHDVYRLKFPKPADFPGNTWTTIRSDDEVYDRIDIIYQTAETVFTLKDIRLVGGKDDGAGMSVEGYASDHYAVIATYKLNAN